MVTRTTPVDVYRNLHESCLSVRSRRTDDYGIVIDHTDDIVIEDATFVVQPAGQKRARNTGTKNVHAVVRGTVADENALSGAVTDVTYNPFEYDTFVTVADERPVSACEVARVRTDGVEAVGIEYADE